MNYYDNEDYPVKIIVDSCAFTMHPITLEDFMNVIENRFKVIPEDCWLELVESFTIQMVRRETTEEYNLRMATLRENRRKYQAKKDASWERQKRKFARARK